MQIGRLTLGDINAVKSLDELGLSKDDIASMIDDGYHRSITIRNNKNLIAFLIFKVCLGEVHKIQVRNLAVSPNERGKGFGRKLFSLLMQIKDINSADVVVYAPSDDRWGLYNFLNKIGFKCFQVKEEDGKEYYLFEVG